MKKFIVQAIIRTVETWEVLARDETEARETYEEGLLLRTYGYEQEGIESVTEQAETTFAN
jgi:hypothetical protein